MNKSHTKLAISFCMTVCAFASQLGTACAQDSQSKNTWAAIKLAMTYSGLGYTKTQRATIDTGQSLYTTSDTTSGLLFTCLKGKFHVAVSLEPQNFRESISTTTRRSRIKYVDMRLGEDDKNSLGRWVYKPEIGTLSSSKRSQPAKLYNAVIRRQTVTLYMSGEKPVILDLPKPNRAFSEFGAECGLGKYAIKNNH